MRTLAAFAIAFAALAGGCGSTVSARRAGRSVMAARPRPVPRALRLRPYRKPVPVLMYHEVRSPPPGSRYPTLFVRRTTFARQMGWLARRGYRAVTIDRLRRAWAGRASMPRRPVVLTFDDGYRSVYRNAVPLLKRLHWPGVLYLELGNTRTPDGATRPQIVRMIRDDWEIGSHTISHPDLTTLGAKRLREETAGARDLIRRWFHRTPRDFCYPVGRYNRTVIRALRRAGYLTSATEVEGLATPARPYEIRRVRVEQSLGVNGLAATIRELGG
jgi:peptidoglycan/xylan/chitin deacetylase (PgdA/CDA1 family)